MIANKIDNWEFFQSHRQPVLHNTEVHIWHLSLAEQGANFDHLKKLLDSGERSAGERFRFQKDRNLYIAAHGFLRLILGFYEGIDPADVQFVRNPYGKPLIAGNNRPEKMMFNLSHSGNRILFAFTRGREIGVDIEKIRADFACQEIAERFFSEQEVAVFNSLPKEKKTEAFFNCWTRKEAFIKAVGEGLSYPLKDFDVTLRSGQEAQLLNICRQSDEASNWTLVDIPVNDEYKGAVAVRAKDLSFKQWALDANFFD